MHSRMTSHRKKPERQSRGDAWKTYVAGSRKPGSPVRGRLKGAQKADWLVIGAGITGLCAAHSLAELHPQARIVVVDRQRAAQGASARNSGFRGGPRTSGDQRIDRHPRVCRLRNRHGDFPGRQRRSPQAHRPARHRMRLSRIGYYFAVSDPRKLTRSRPNCRPCARWALLLSFCKVNSCAKTRNPALPGGDLVRQWQCVAATGEVRQRSARCMPRKSPCLKTPTSAVCSA